MNEVYNELDPTTDKKEKELMITILKHKWKDSGLQLQFKSNMGDLQ